MMGMYKKFMARHGLLGLIRVLIFPITTLISTPIALLATLWNSRVLLYKPYKNFSTHNVISGLNGFFYYTRAYNLARYGRRGTTPLIGLGKYSMARFFHYTKPSLYLYWKANAMMVMVCMFGWLGSHFIWTNEMGTNWVTIVTLLTMVSTLFFANTFRLMNYNSLGWLLFPILLYTIYIENWIAVASVLFLISWGSFTVVFISALILGFVTMITLSVWPALAALPAVIKLAFHFLPFLDQGQDRSILTRVLKGIGFMGGNVRYRRKNKRLTFKALYFIGLSTLFASVYLWHYGFDNVLIAIFIFSIVIATINASMFRFADDQSIFMLIFSASIPLIILHENYFLLFTYWLLASPLPVFIGYDYNTKAIDHVPVSRPFNVESYLSNFEDFLRPVQKGEKVMIAFDDPDNIYEKIYSGYRNIIEVPVYVLTLKNARFIPDWWAVMSEMNYEGADDFWGTDVESVQQNIAKCDAEYLIVYQTENEELDPKWESKGFKNLGKYDWSIHQKDFANHKKINVEKLRWWLLKVPETM